MSNNYVYIGWYVEAQTIGGTEYEGSRVCSHHPEHPIMQGGDFCPICGNQVVFAAVARHTQRHFSALLKMSWQPPFHQEDWRSSVPEQDKSTLVLYFGNLSQDKSLRQPGVDVVYPIDSCCYRIIDLPPHRRISVSPSLERPNDDMVALLARTMKYSSYEVKYGMVWLED